MNPFDWYGPQFLAFYIVFAVAVLILLRMALRAYEGGDPDGRTGALNDPYRIALLREGPKEMVRVAVVSLIDRGLLQVDDGGVRTTAVGAATQARRRLERRLLEVCVEARDPERLFTSPEFDPIAFEYERELERMQLLPDDDMRARRRWLIAAAWAALLLVAGIKIGLALQRGRTNVGILIFLAFLACALARSVVSRRTTARGDRLLADVRNLFRSLRSRTIQPGGATTDLVMLAGVFGAYAVPFEWKKKLFPQVSSSGSSDSSSSSSCGSSCGGGCGGGGCGGCGG